MEQTVIFYLVCEIKKGFLEDTEFKQGMEKKLYKCVSFLGKKRQRRVFQGDSR